MRNILTLLSKALQCKQETQEQMRARIKANMQQDTASKIWAGVIQRVM